ncbi:Dual specificity protein kinase lkh1 [Escovopsis weberi]|uniref:Dual specificity protein kinase lkh1 n=1 Tax=Escovopsis weberi TaxID=150374 RepID=A0A0M8MPL4_ESCWE|nr:Dual specificity protein kinase lkh1 [Escovopsis weberi]
MQQDTLAPPRPPPSTPRHPLHAAAGVDDDDDDDDDFPQPSPYTTTPARKRPRMPDWAEFYKNGVPREIIVIEDTPEPPLQNNAASSASASSSSASASSSSSSSSILFHGTAPKEPLTKPQFPPAAAAAAAAPPAAATATAATAAAVTRKRKFQDLSRTDKTTGHSSGTADLSSTRPTTPKSKTVDPAPAAADPKRRRTRLQHEQESNLKHRLSRPADVPYRGLSGPVKRPGNVYIRTAYPTCAIDKRKLDDEDGHYIVVPDTTLADQYQIKKLLGQGTFGKVVQALDRATNQLVAVKVIRSVQKYRDAAKIELRVLRTLRENDSENEYRCIRFRDCFDFYGHTCIVMDLLDSSLFDFLKANSFVPFPNSHIQSFARQLLTSVAYLKPENVLLRDASYQTFTYNRTVPCSRTVTPRQAAQRRVLLSSDIRLIDFGSATFQDEYHSSVVATRHYRAPEIILGLGWSFPCDIWSIGCILIEFFTGDALFQTHDNLEHLAIMEMVFGSRIDMDMIRQVNKTTSKSNGAASYFKRLKLNYPTAETSKASRRFVRTMKSLEDIIPKTNSFLHQFLDLLRKMFVYDPARRITAKEALLHPWFQEFSRDDGTEAAKIALERQEMAKQAALSQI